MHPIDLSCHQKFEKIHRPETEILALNVGIWKCHGRLDPTLRMCDVVHAHSIEFPRVRNDRPSIQTYLWSCEKEIFFRSIVLRVTGKETKIGWQEFYRLHLH